MRRLLFTVLCFLLTLSSILAPLPDWLSNGIDITGSGGGLQVATAADLSKERSHSNSSNSH